MNSKWTQKWKSILIWASAYINFIAFALVGGYAVVKTEDENLKKTAKQALIVTLIFSALSAFLALFSNIAGFSDSYYSSSAYDFYNVFSKIVNIAKIVVFAAIIVYELVKKEKAQEEQTTKEA